MFLFRLRGMKFVAAKIHRISYTERGKTKFFSPKKFVIQFANTLIFSIDVLEKFVMSFSRVKKTVFNPTFALENRT